MRRPGESFVKWAAAVAACAHSTCAHAETPAGTPIVNVAQLTVANGATAISSNPNTIIVAERLDVTLAASGIEGPVGALLTNTGNGREAFAITAAAISGAVRIAVDGDGDGRYGAARDADLLDGRTPLLAPGQAITLFAITAGPGEVTIVATAVTGSGAPGTAFMGSGDGGGDAVTGPTGGIASITISPATDASAPTLIKSADVAAPDGSTRAMRGATITYTLVARFPGATSRPRIADAIPAGTAYLPASLTLDGIALSDAADADAGDATAAGIAVALPDQPAGAVRTVRFKVAIQ